MRHLKPLILVVFGLLLLPLSALATIDFQQAPPIDLQQPIKAMAPSFDGMTYFVLGADSNLYIYKANGKKEGQVKVDPSMDMISMSGFRKANIPEVIILSSSTTGAIQQITYEKTAEFNVTGSPFIGNPDAKVTIVIFSDFQ